MDSAFVEIGASFMIAVRKARGALLGFTSQSVLEVLARLSNEAARLFEHEYGGTYCRSSISTREPCSGRLLSIAVFLRRVLLAAVVRPLPSLFITALLRGHVFGIKAAAGGPTKPCIAVFVIVLSVASLVPASDSESV